MNDEDLARHAFAAAFRDGQTGEPPTLPDVELLARHGRLANRTRHGVYAAGTTALAGVAVVGVVAGPTLLGLGSASPSGVGTGAQGATTPPASPAPTSSKSAPNTAKSSPGVPCTTPPAIDWAGILATVLPAGVTATADHSANCAQLPDGTRTIEASFKLSTGEVGLQVDVATGPEIARKLSAGLTKVGVDGSPEPGIGSPDPATVSQLDAAKLAAVGLPPDSGVETTSPSPSLNAAAVASRQAQKRAAASVAATASPAPGDASGAKGTANGMCSQVNADENMCVSHVSKDSASVVDVQLLRTGSSPVVVDVTASNGKNLTAAAPAQLPNDATMVALAEAVATHF